MLLAVPKRPAQRGARIGSAAAAPPSTAQPQFSRYPLAGGAVTQLARPTFSRYAAAAIGGAIRKGPFLIGLLVAAGPATKPRPAYRWGPDITYGGAAPSGFPTQYLGLRVFYSGATRDLCLVAEADAPSGMGAQIRLRKGGVSLCVYLVETGDANASKVRVRTTTGTKAVRLKT